MTSRFDIAVIGGGLIGLALARALAPKTPALAVIDAAARIPPATRAAAGMLAPSFEEALGGEALYELSVASLGMWPGFAAALEDETGLDVDFRGLGILGAALDSAGAARLETQAAAIAKRGGDVRMLTGDEARNLEPALSVNIAAALLAPQDAQVDPVKMMMALRASLQQRGVALIDAFVESASPQSSGWRIVRADGADVIADEIVIATGAARDWPIAGTAPPPVFAVKGEAYAAAAPPSFSLQRVVRGPGAYVCPKAGGRIVVGASEHRGLSDLAVSAAAIDALKAGAADVAPAMASSTEIERWAGLRPATPDAAPILGRCPGDSGAWCALGHYRNGILLAPASAAALAAEILEEGSEIDLSPFRADRFE